jgi:glycolate oxidase
MSALEHGALLEDLTGTGDVVTDRDVLESYRRDQAAPGMVEAGMPVLLVRHGRRSTSTRPASEPSIRTGS